MKIQDFKADGESRWEELDALSKRAGRRAERLPAEKLMRLMELYRATVADLAIARRCFPRHPIVHWLETRVVKVRGQLFDREGRRQGIGSFLTVGYWRLLSERRRVILVSAGILLIPALVGFLWAVSDPDTLKRLVPSDFTWLVDAEGTDQGMSKADLMGFSAYVMGNNIRVTLLSFALGITWGVLTGFVMAENGLILGAIAGLAVEAGNWKVLVEAIAAHGVLELSCIVVGGAAGLGMGRAMLWPGTKTRLEALGDEARDLAMLVLGTAPWLVLAGLVEGFLSRTGTDWVPSLVIGILLGALFWGLAYWLGPVRQERA